MEFEMVQSEDSYPTMGAGKLAGKLSIRKELEIEIQEYKKRLENKEKLLKLLDENPVIEQFMNLSRGL